MKQPRIRISDELKSWLVQDQDGKTVLKEGAPEHIKEEFKRVNEILKKAPSEGKRI